MKSSVAVQPSRLRMSGFSAFGIRPARLAANSAALTAPAIAAGARLSDTAKVLYSACRTHVQKVRDGLKSF